MSSSMSAANLRKRRGVVKALLTQLDTRLKYLEEAADRSSTRDPARQLSSKLKEYDAELKAAHLSLIDLINDDDTPEREQANLDVLIEAHAIRIAASEESSATATKVDERKVLSCRLNRLLGRLSSRRKQSAPCQVNTEIPANANNMMNSCVITKEISSI